MGSPFARNTICNHCSLLSDHTPLSGICTYTKRPPNPTQNTPFPGLNWKVGNMNYHLGKMRPQLGNMFEKWQFFSRSGQKEYIHSIPTDATHWHPPLLSLCSPWRPGSLRAMIWGLRILNKGRLGSEVLHEPGDYGFVA